MTCLSGTGHSLKVFMYSIEFCGIWLRLNYWKHTFQLDLRILQRLQRRNKSIDDEVVEGQKWYFVHWKAQPEASLRCHNRTSRQLIARTLNTKHSYLESVWRQAKGD